jgi:exosortase/archaeosortase family protein
VTAGALPGRPASHRASHRSGGRRGDGRRGAGGNGSGGNGSGGHGRRGGRSPQAAAGAGARTGQILASVLCCALAAAAVKENYLLRGFEAGLASHVIAFVTSRPAGSIPQTPTFWFTVGPHQEMGLQISAACTVVLMMTPFLIATAFLVWRRSHTVRPVVACVVAIAMLLVVNQLRILTIIMFVLHLGYAGGFYWGHTLVGSLITIVGGSATLVVYGLIAIRRGTSGRTRQSAR